MRYRTLAVFGISVTLLGARARAASDDAETKPAKTKGGTSEGWDDDADAKADRSETKTKAKAKVKEADVDGAVEADKADAEKAEKDNSKTKAEAKNDNKDEEAVPTPVADVRLDGNPPPMRAPVYGKRSDWFIEPYGYARLDAIEDSTQSFEDGIQPNLIQRAGTYRGDHRRTIFTARDSRLGVFVGAPNYRGMRTSGQVEMDFYGLVPTDARRHDSVVFGPLRIRLAYFKLETSLFDVIAGQYYDLFGWNSYFYPMTVAYLGVPAQVYHRNPQLRLEKKIHLGQLEIQLAAAAVRPGERDSGLPEGQLGLRLSYAGWAGAATPGFGRPTLAPASIGVSGLYRAFEVPVFRAEPGSTAVKTYGYGFAASLLLPIIPIKNVQDRGNALTVTGEFTIGTGIADMYTFMDGGSRFPILPNPNLSQPAIQYQANVDPGLVTFDRNLDVKTINWEAFVVGAQYYTPIDNGRVWVSGLYSRIWSNNIKDLTPFPSWGGIFTKMEYADANVGIDITPAVVLGLSFQTVVQTFGDVSADTPIYGTIPGAALGGLSMPGTGGVAAHARNNRGQLSMSFFF